MRIALGADHRGVDARAQLTGALEQLRHTVVEYGACDPHEPCDYPDAAYHAATAVSAGECDMAILVCGTGIGMCIAANKVRGIRAALVSDEVGAELSRRHNNANVLCLSGEMLSPAIMEQIIQVWLNTPFEGGRHTRRVQKLAAIEAGHDPSHITEPAGSSADDLAAALTRDDSHAPASE